MRRLQTVFGCCGFGFIGEHSIIKQTLNLMKKSENMACIKILYTLPQTCFGSAQGVELVPVGSPGRLEDHLDVYCFLVWMHLRFADYDWSSMWPGASVISQKGISSQGSYLQVLPLDPGPKVTWRRRHHRN